MKSLHENIYAHLIHEQFNENFENAVLEYLVMNYRRTDLMTEEQKNRYDFVKSNGPRYIRSEFVRKLDRKILIRADLTFPFSKYITNLSEIKIKIKRYWKETHQKKFFEKCRIR